MKKIVSLAVILPALGLTSSLFAEEGFQNNLQSSPAIVSPSQIYQVQGTRAEAQVGYSQGSVKFNGDEDFGLSDVTTDTSSVLTTGAAYYGAGLAAGGVSLNYSKSKFKSGDSVSYSEGSETHADFAVAPTSFLSLGLRASFVNFKDSGAGSETNAQTDYQTFGLGVTAHGSDWESTLYVQGHHKDSGNFKNQSPAGAILGGRYRVAAPLALGLNVAYTDHKDLDKELENSVTVTPYVEWAATPDVAVEASLSTAKNAYGVKDTDQLSATVQGTFKATETLSVGGFVRFDSQKSDDVEATSVTPAVFVSAKI